MDVEAYFIGEGDAVLVVEVVVAGVLMVLVTSDDWLDTRTKSVQAIIRALGLKNVIIFKMTKKVVFDFTGKGLKQVKWLKAAMKVNRKINWRI